MAPSTKKTWTVVVFLTALFSSLVLQVPAVQSAEVSVEERTQVYLTAVVGLDLTKYNITGGENIPPSPHPFFNVSSAFEEQHVTYKLDSDNSNVEVSCHFMNGMIEWCKLYFRNGLPIYAQSPSTNIKEATKTLIQKYQSFVSQNYGADTSYLEPARTMINSVEVVQPLTQVAGNVKLDISTEDKTRIQWIYTENSIEAPIKRIEFEFDSDGTFYYFRDSWNFYTVGTWNTISEEEVVSLALETAENYSMKFVGENDSSYEVKPDMSNVTYDVWMIMSPRDTSLLYPYWRVWFYFDKPINNVYGVAVGIWGDTLQIEDCSEIGHLGGPDGDSTSPNESPTGIQPENNQTSTYIIVSGAAIAVAVALAAVALKKKNK